VGTRNVYASTTNTKILRNGILLSGCQSDQTSADASPFGNHDQAYRACSIAIQIIGSMMKLESIK
ncbi:Metacaspase-5, partial [Bienertia sinuspersici]